MHGPFASLRVTHQSRAHPCWLKSTTGRTSTLPIRTDGIRDATWMASFRSLASIR